MITTKRNIPAGIIFIFSAIFLQFFCNLSFDNNVFFALFGIDDALLAMGIGSLAGGLGDLFGPKKETYDMEYLKRHGFNPMNAGQEKGELSRRISSRLKGRRTGINARNSQSGLNNPTDVYSNEEDLINAEAEGIANIDEAKKLEDKQIASLLMQLEAGQSDETDVSNFVGGALTGAGVGANIGSLLNKGNFDPGKFDPAGEGIGTGTDTSRDNSFNPEEEFTWDYKNKNRSPRLADYLRNKRSSSYNN